MKFKDWDKVKELCLQIKTTKRKLKTIEENINFSGTICLHTKDETVHLGNAQFTDDVFRMAKIHLEHHLIELEQQLDKY